MEKKLTNEEVIKSLTYCCDGNGHCEHREDCPLRNESDCTTVLARYSLELIHRLQAENERLTEEREDIRLFQLSLQNGEIDMTIESPMAKSFYDCLVQIFEQNGAKNFFTTTIELESQKCKYAFTIEKVGGVTVAERIAELQKQVDELKEEFKKAYEIERANIQAEIAEAGTSCHWCKNVTVKDTAKEILQSVGDMVDDGDDRFKYKDYQWHKRLCERYGVEVE
jgi:hypothetical protein